MHAAILLALGCASNTGFSSSPTDPVAPDGEALAEFEPAELNFDAAIPGVLYAQEVTLRSVGDGDLLFYSAQVLDDFSEAFDIANGEGTTTITLEPGDETSVLVQLILPDDTAAYATVLLQTNDADQLKIEIPATATPAPPDTGDTGG
jgi:hypothetical protein